MSWLGLETISRHFLNVFVSAVQRLGLVSVLNFTKKSCLTLGLWHLRNIHVWCRADIRLNKRKIKINDLIEGLWYIWQLVIHCWVRCLILLCKLALVTLNGLCVVRCWSPYSHWFLYPSRTSMNLAMSRRLELKLARNTVLSTILVRGLGLCFSIGYFHCHATDLRGSAYTVAFQYVAI